MTTVFLGDTFSLDESLNLGRPVANTTLVRSIFLSEAVTEVLAVGSPAIYSNLNLPGHIAGKLRPVTAIGDLPDVFRERRVGAIFCSSFGQGYAQLVHFRNLNRLTCPVFGFTHTLSYQDEVGAIYRLFCAGARKQDGILCTSAAAIDVVGKLMDSVRKTLSFNPGGPSLVHFPLGHGAVPPEAGTARTSSHFQVMYLGRINWMNKADLLVIPRVLDCLPAGHNIRFVIAGNAGNREYLALLERYCSSPHISIIKNISDEEKNRLLAESHVLFSPSDNYQETFGLTVLEAKHHGCVPVVSDFNGYRDLVDNGRDGVLLDTFAARIPEPLWNVQILMPNNIYHSWWAAGVSIDPQRAATVLHELSADRKAWETMSLNAVNSAGKYNVDATAARFSRLLDSVRDSGAVSPATAPATGNPFHIDYTDIFGGHPTTYWKNQEVMVTRAGLEFIRKPAVDRAPQLMLLANTLQPADIARLLESIQNGANVKQLLASGHQPMTLSVALKNNLIAVAG